MTLFDISLRVHCESKNLFRTFLFSSITVSDVDDSFTVVTVKYLHTNVELNLPHHLNYVVALPCKIHIFDSQCTIIIKLDGGLS